MTLDVLRRHPSRAHPYLVLYGRQGPGATQDSVNLIANVTRYPSGLVLYYDHNYVYSALADLTSRECDSRWRSQ